MARPALLLLALLSTMTAMSPIGPRLGRSFAVAGVLVLLGVAGSAISLRSAQSKLLDTLIEAAATAEPTALTRLAASAGSH